MYTYSQDRLQYVLMAHSALFALNGRFACISVKRLEDMPNESLTQDAIFARANWTEFVFAAEHI